MGGEGGVATPQEAQLTPLVLLCLPVKNGIGIGRITLLHPFEQNQNLKKTLVAEKSQN